MIFSMDLWVGALLAVLGLGLAVMLGMVLYRGPKLKGKSARKSLRDQQA